MFLDGQKGSSTNVPGPSRTVTKGRVACSVIKLLSPRTVTGCAHVLTVAARVARRWFAELHHLRCCALILSYMTERIMTFVVCVQRVLSLERRHYFRKFLSSSAGDISLTIWRNLSTPELTTRAMSAPLRRSRAPREHERRERSRHAPWRFERACLLAYNSCVGSTWALSFVGQTIMSVVFFIFILLHLLVARAIHTRDPGQTDRRQTDRRTDGRMDGQTDRRT